MIRHTLVAALAVLAFSFPAMATTLNFDDVVLDSGFAAMPDGYGGFTYSEGWNVVSQDILAIYGNDTTNWPSTANAAYNGGETTVTITSSTYFDFDGASFMGWAMGNQEFSGWTATELTLAGYRDGNLVDTFTFSLSDTSGNYDWLLVDTAIQCIDTLSFTAPEYTYWLVDNLSLTSPSTVDPNDPSVPEPLSLSLLAVGAMAMLRRRK